jgi:hypothetical protein
MFEKKIKMWQHGDSRFSPLKAGVVHFVAKYILL